MQVFERDLMTNLLSLQESLAEEWYEHGDYHAFVVSDPKRRQIHKASVRDRIVHRAVYRNLYPYFDKRFIFDSYSCRSGKGTHRAVDRFRCFGRKASRNHRKTVWVLKCDIRTFFASIDHSVLLAILNRAISDRRTMHLISKIVSSYSANSTPGVGLPLGNLTSQLFSNVYMNEFDQFMKHVLKVKYYIRYADDFVLISHNRRYLEQILPLLRDFLTRELRLELHPKKIELRTFASGADFLGWVHFPRHRVLRTTTKRRVLRSLSDDPSPGAVASYLGLLKHGDTYRLRSRFGFW